MNESNLNQTTKRRGFIGTIAAGAAALGLSTLASPFKLDAQQQKAAPPAKKAPGMPTPMHPADAWFNKVKGTHRVVYDCTQPHEIMPFAWPAIFLMTNAA